MAGCISGSFTSGTRAAYRFKAERVEGERTVAEIAGRSHGCRHGRRLRLLRHRLDDFLLTLPESSDLRAPKHTILYRLFQFESGAWFEGSAAWSTWSCMPPTTQTSRSPAPGREHKGWRLSSAQTACFQLLPKWSTLYKA